MQRVRTTGKKDGSSPQLDRAMRANRMPWPAPRSTRVNAVIKNLP
jgi:hypothetical protein